RTSYLPAASDELIEMLRLSLIINQVSDGAFDVTIGALLDLWQVDSTVDTQFRDLSAEAQGELIAEAQEHVGMNRILLGSGRKTSISLVPGTRIELDGIAKGYAVDAAIDTLRETGIEHASVEAGSNLRVYGGKPDGSLWEIVLCNPNDPDECVAWFQLSEGAIATSGSYERFFDSTIEITQVIDPRTGYPSKAASSATVVAPTCAEAEALARAAFVLGPEAGLALIERLGSTEMLIIGFEDPQDVQRSSGIAAFEKLPRD
ncbi:FAD:protein FMN transferase, partial [Candidatus Bipolaricaulota bacterium]|nr:FAD:protein FMN transferase [Candidatus Bipolaricaulota bacterium]